MLERKWSTVVRLQKKVSLLVPHSHNVKPLAMFVLSLHALHIYRCGLQVIELESKLAALDPKKPPANTDFLPSLPASYVLSGHRGSVTHVVFHPVFSTVASCSDDATIVIWDVDTGAIERTLKGHTKAVNHIAYDGEARSGSLLASCSSDLSIKIWDAKSDYKCLKTLHGHDDIVSSVEFVPPGDFLVSASKDKTIKVWEVATGYCMRTIYGHTEFVRMVTPTSDGRLLASCSNDHVSVSSSAVSEAALAQIAFFGQTIQVSSLSTGETVSTITGHSHVVECVAFAPFEACRTILKTLNNGGEAKVGQFVASGSRDNSIRIWDSESGACVFVLTGHNNWVRSLQFHPNGKFLISASDDKSMRVWDLGQPLPHSGVKCIHVADNVQSQFLTSVAVHLRGYVACGGENGSTPVSMAPPRREQPLPQSPPDASEARPAPAPSVQRDKERDKESLFARLALSTQPLRWSPKASVAALAATLPRSSTNGNDSPRTHEATSTADISVRRSKSNGWKAKAHSQPLNDRTHSPASINSYKPSSSWITSGWGAVVEGTNPDRKPLSLPLPIEPPSAATSAWPSTPSPVQTLNITGAWRDPNRTPAPDGAPEWGGVATFASDFAVANSDANNDDAHAVHDHANSLRQPKFSNAPFETVGDGRWKILDMIGSGSFGDVFAGIEVASGLNVAVKRELISSRRQLLPHENTIYSLLKRTEGFPRIYNFGTEGPFNFLVMERLGPSLRQLEKASPQQKIPLRTMVQLVPQFIQRLQKVHELGIVFRDVKPDQFCIGRYGQDISDRPTVYLIDFGLATSFRDNQGKHIKSPKPLKNSAKTGTARYASLNVHKGKIHSRRDDLESLGYMLVEAVKGPLPWTGIKAVTSVDGWRRIGICKDDMVLAELCSGIPEEFATIIEHARELRFADDPNYSRLVSLFVDLLWRLDNEEDANADRQSRADSRTEQPRTLRQQRRGRLEWRVELADDGADNSGYWQ
ncbi:hypothetical protein HDU83_009740 [Entophlyctis luteolus]|nr:hypothetical protein HDU83_009740 [Entophlyctis luteolus]